MTIMENQHCALWAVSPVDGRYANKTAILRNYFSEGALIIYRLKVEVEYFIALKEYGIDELKDISADQLILLRNIYLKLTDRDILRIKEIENITNHDVKAVEYFLKEKFNEIGLERYVEFVHFGLTSQDVNNTAIPMAMRDFHQEQLKQHWKTLHETLEHFASMWKDIPMLARTHGQPASPTTIGKEFKVFAERFSQQLNYFNHIPFAAKFAGATGNFNAHKVAYPDIDWYKFAKDFVENRLLLQYSFPTTQIEHYDHLAAYFDAIKRLNVILLDLCRDVWQYISMEYFVQMINENEVGSSAMPHKVNPIDFENAEGNLGISNALLIHFGEKLPISRLQRDLTDSTVLRNLGVALAHHFIALQSIFKGFQKIMLNPDKIKQDLDENWAVLAEAIQTYLRKINYPHPYETLKKLTRRNEKINRQTIHEFIDSLEIGDEEKKYLKNLSPFNYTGIAGL